MPHWGFDSSFFFSGGFTYRSVVPLTLMGYARASWVKNDDGRGALGNRGKYIHAGIEALRPPHRANLFAIYLKFEC